MIEKAPRTENEMTYEEALLYCQFLEYDGHSDWRLPTEEEYHESDICTSWHVGTWWSNRRNWLVTPVRTI